MDLVDKSVIEALDNSAYEMATIGQFMQKVGDNKGKTGFRVYVTSDGRPLSHIHIVQKDAIKKKICVEFSNPPKYFKHDVYIDTFTKDEAREFNEFLKRPYKYPQVFRMGKLKFDVRTYWDYCIYQWKLENDEGVDNMSLQVDSKGFVIFPEQPDYTTLEG